MDATGREVFGKKDLLKTGVDVDAWPAKHSIPAQNRMAVRRSALWTHSPRGSILFPIRAASLPSLFSDRREEERLKITSLGRIGVRSFGAGSGGARRARERVKEGKSKVIKIEWNLNEGTPGRQVRCWGSGCYVCGHGCNLHHP